MNIKIGTRKSLLALKQTQIVIDAIKKVCPEAICQVIEISTKGDKILDKPLLEFGGKGVFVTEFEEAILNGTIDIAVHSGKDLPTTLAEGLEIVATPCREDANDVLVTLKGSNSPKKIGTGSIRRIFLAQKLFPNAQFVPLRGNVPTRLGKMENGEIDGVILAAAGLNRLGILAGEKYNIRSFNSQTFIPAPCQGIIAVEGRKNCPVADLVGKINHAQTKMCFDTERLILNILGADCHDAVGIYSRINGSSFRITAFMGDSDLKNITVPLEEYLAGAEKLAGEFF